MRKLDQTTIRSKTQAKQAEFVALRAIKEAEAIANRARGKAAAQQLLRRSLTPELLQRQAIEKWNGNLPFIVGGEGTKLLDLKQRVETSQKSNLQRR